MPKLLRIVMRMSAYLSSRTVVMLLHYVLPLIPNGGRFKHLSVKRASDML